jgi:predicted  nucleic acid-binding Zn-ribbon protein
MMRAEEAERRLKLAESRLREAEQSLAAEKKTIEAQASDIRKQLEAAAAEREKIVAPVPEDLRDLYARIAKRHGGTALAQVRDDQCRGCGLRVLPHIVQELRSETSEEVYRCESCGLILFARAGPLR